MEQDSPKNQDTQQAETSLDRISIIRTVQTPLGFFVLVVLVVKTILGIVAGLSEGMDRTIIIIGMLVIIGGLVGIVAFLAYNRPEALQGVRAGDATSNISVEAESKNWEAEYLHFDVSKSTAQNDLSSLAKEIQEILNNEFSARLEQSELDSSSNGDAATITLFINGSTQGFPTRITFSDSDLQEETQTQVKDILKGIQFPKPLGDDIVTRTESGGSVDAREYIFRCRLKYMGETTVAG